MREVIGNDNTEATTRESGEFCIMAAALSSPPTKETELPRTKPSASEMDAGSLLGALVLGGIAFALWHVVQPMGPTPPTQAEVKLLKMLQPQISENVRIIKCQPPACDIKLSGEEFVRFRRQQPRLDYGTGIVGFTYLATPKEGSEERFFRVDNLNVDRVPATLAYQHLLADIQAATNYALMQQTNRQKAELAAKQNRASYEN